MNKYLTRIIALLLIPCLLVDPASATILHNPFYLTRERIDEGRMRRESKFFTQQALTERATQFIGWMTPNAQPKYLTLQLAYVALGYLSAHLGHPFVGDGIGVMAMIPNVRRIGVLFPSPSSANPDMTANATQLYDKYSAVRSLYDLASRHSGFSVGRLFFQKKDYGSHAIAWLATVLYSMSLYRVLEEKLGETFKPAIVAGNGGGVLSAMAIAGAVALEDIARLIPWSIELKDEIGRTVDHGVLVIENCPYEQIKDLMVPGAIEPMQIDSPVYITLAIARGVQVNELQNRILERAGPRVCLSYTETPKVKAPHSSFFNAGRDTVKEQVQALSITAPEIPIVFSSREEGLISSAADVREELESGSFLPVFWSHSIDRMMKLGVKLLLEIGPGSKLTERNHKGDLERPALAINSESALDSFLRKSTIEASYATDPEILSLRTLLPPRLEDSDEMIGYLRSRFGPYATEAILAMGHQLLDRRRSTFIDLCLERFNPSFISDPVSVIYAIADLLHYGLRERKRIEDCFPKEFLHFVIDHSIGAGAISRSGIDPLWKLKNIEADWRELIEKARRLSQQPNYLPKGYEEAILDEPFSFRPQILTGPLKASDIRFERKPMGNKRQGESFTFSVWLTNKDLLGQLVSPRVGINQIYLQNGLLLGSIKFFIDDDRGVRTARVDQAQAWLRGEHRFPRQLRKAIGSVNRLLEETFQQYASELDCKRIRVPSASTLFLKTWEPIHRNTVRRLDDMYKQAGYERPVFAHNQWWREKDITVPATAALSPPAAEPSPAAAPMNAAWSDLEVGKKTAPPLPDIVISVTDMDADDLKVRQKKKDESSKPAHLYQALPMSAMTLFATLPIGTQRVSIPHEQELYRGYFLGRAKPAVDAGFVIDYHFDPATHLYKAAGCFYREQYIPLADFYTLARDYTQEQYGELELIPNRFDYAAPSWQRWRTIVGDGGYTQGSFEQGSDTVTPELIKQSLEGRPKMPRINTAPAGLIYRIPVFRSSKHPHMQIDVFAPVEVNLDPNPSVESQWISYEDYQAYRARRSRRPDVIKADFQEWLVKTARAWGFRTFLFSPGMLFKATREWWGRCNPRLTDHEGDDFAKGIDVHGQIVDATQRLPVFAVADGEAVHIYNDFMAKSMAVRYPHITDDFGYAFHSLYVHFEPSKVWTDQLKNGPVKVRKGDLLGYISKDPGKAPLTPVHLHYSETWIPLDVDWHRMDPDLTWDRINPNFMQFFLVDPFEGVAGVRRPVEEPTDVAFEIWPGQSAATSEERRPLPKAEPTSTAPTPIPARVVRPPTPDDGTGLAMMADTWYSRLYVKTPNIRVLRWFRRLLRNHVATWIEEWRYTIKPLLEAAREGAVEGIEDAIPGRGDILDWIAHLTLANKAVLSNSTNFAVAHEDVLYIDPKGEEHWEELEVLTPDNPVPASWAALTTLSRDAAMAAADAIRYSRRQNHGYSQAIWRAWKAAAHEHTLHNIHVERRGGYVAMSTGRKRNSQEPNAVRQSPMNQESIDGYLRAAAICNRSTSHLLTVYRFGTVTGLSMSDSESVLNELAKTGWLEQIRYTTISPGTAKKYKLTQKARDRLKVLTGKRSASAAHSAKQAEPESASVPQSDSLEESLSPEEQIIANLLAQGKSAGQIRAIVDISERVLQTYQIAICSKLGLPDARNRDLIILRLHRNGLVPRPPQKLIDALLQIHDEELTFDQVEILGLVGLEYTEFDAIATQLPKSGKTIQRQVKDIDRTIKRLLPGLLFKRSEANLPDDDKAIDEYEVNWAVLAIIVAVYATPESNPTAFGPYTTKPQAEKMIFNFPTFDRKYGPPETRHDQPFRCEVKGASADLWVFSQRDNLNWRMATYSPEAIQPWIVWPVMVRTQSLDISNLNRYARPLGIRILAPTPGPDTGQRTASNDVPRLTRWHRYLGMMGGAAGGTWGVWHLILSPETLPLSIGLLALWTIGSAVAGMIVADLVSARWAHEMLGHLNRVRQIPGFEEARYGKFEGGYTLFTKDGRRVTRELLGPYADAVLDAGPIRSLYWLLAAVLGLSLLGFIAPTWLEWCVVQPHGPALAPQLMISAAYSLLAAIAFSSAIYFFADSMLRRLLAKLRAVPIAMSAGFVAGTAVSVILGYIEVAFLRSYIPSTVPIGPLAGILVSSASLFLLKWLTAPSPTVSFVVPNDYPKVIQALIDIHDQERSNTLKQDSGGLAVALVEHVKNRIQAVFAATNAKKQIVGARILWEPDANEEKELGLASVRGAYVVRLSDQNNGIGTELSAEAFRWLKARGYPRYAALIENGNIKSLRSLLTAARLVGAPVTSKAHSKKKRENWYFVDLASAGGEPENAGWSRAVQREKQEELFTKAERFLPGAPCPIRIVETGRGARRTILLVSAWTDQEHVHVHSIAILLDTDSSAPPGHIDLNVTRSEWFEIQREARHAETPAKFFEWLTRPGLPSIGASSVPPRHLPECARTLRDFAAKLDIGLPSVSAPSGDPPAPKTIRRDDPNLPSRQASERVRDLGESSSGQPLQRALRPIYVIGLLLATPVSAEAYGAAPWKAIFQLGQVLIGSYLVILFVSETFVLGYQWVRRRKDAAFRSFPSASVVDVANSPAFFHPSETWRPMVEPIATIPLSMSWAARLSAVGLMLFLWVDSLVKVRWVRMMTLVFRQPKQLLLLRHVLLVLSRFYGIQQIPITVIGAGDYGREVWSIADTAFHLKDEKAEFQQSQFDIVGVEKDDRAFVHFQQTVDGKLSIPVADRQRSSKRNRHVAQLNSSLQKIRQGIHMTPWHGSFQDLSTEQISQTRVMFFNHVGYLNPKDIFTFISKVKSPCVIFMSEVDDFFPLLVEMKRTRGGYADLFARFEIYRIRGDGSYALVAKNMPPTQPASGPKQRDPPSGWMPSPLRCRLTLLSA